VVAVWVLAAVAAVVILTAAGPADRPGLFALALAGAVVATFTVQVFFGETAGFVTRAVVSTTGALGILAVASGVGALLP
jgi:hypothetical protein